MLDTQDSETLFVCVQKSDDDGHEDAYDYVTDEAFWQWHERIDMEVAEWESCLANHFEEVAARVQNLRWNQDCMWTIDGMEKREEKWQEFEKAEMDHEDKRSRLQNVIHDLNEEIKISSEAKRRRLVGPPKPPAGPPPSSMQK